MLPHENPHVDRSIRDLLKQLHTQTPAAPPKPVVDFRSLPYEALRQAAQSIEPVYSQLVTMAVGAYPDPGRPPEHREIAADNGQRLAIDIFRPTQACSGLLPCIVYCHGGGMAFATPQVFRPFLQRLSDLGAVVVAPYFRNSPVARFPAGVSDCLSAVLWAQENRTSLGIQGVTLAGESGGGLLALTVPLLALRRGLQPASLLHGVWADSPLCAGPGAVDDPPRRSQVDYDGYLMTQDLLLLIRRLYTDDESDGCAFPLNADATALRQFPKTTVVVYECDPLRDEGLDFYRKLIAAGHPDADCIELHGLTHCAMIFAALKPAFVRRQLQRLLAFASVTPPPRLP